MSIRAVPLLLVARSCSSFLLKDDENDVFPVVSIARCFPTSRAGPGQCHDRVKTQKWAFGYCAGSRFDIFYNTRTSYAVLYSLATLEINIDHIGADLAVFRMK